MMFMATPAFETVVDVVKTAMDAEANAVRRAEAAGRLMLWRLPVGPEAITITASRLVEIEGIRPVRRERHSSRP